jgi:diaminohydroxyphosphoribosylaminopyrimidine deaminase/5-amino-6-(5-phosphoribosylamino)uracil reductase
MFDWRLRVPREARVFSTLSAGPVIMMTTSEAVGNREAHAAELRDRGVVVEVIEGVGSSRISIALERLAAREILSLLVEGGPALHQAFLERDLVDRVQWIRTPKELGSGVSAWDPAKYGIDLAAARAYSAGSDTLLEVHVHRPD